MRSPRGMVKGRDQPAAGGWDGCRLKHRRSCGFGWATGVSTLHVTAKTKSAAIRPAPLSQDRRERHLPGMATRPYALQPPRHGPHRKRAARRKVAGCRRPPRECAGSPPAPRRAGQRGPGQMRPVTASERGSSCSDSARRPDQFLEERSQWLPSWRSTARSTSSTVELERNVMAVERRGGMRAGGVRQVSDLDGGRPVTAGARTGPAREGRPRWVHRKETAGRSGAPVQASSRSNRARRSETRPRERPRRPVEHPPSKTQRAAGPGPES